MFSVVIPAYNCEGTIYYTLESVINQSRFDLIDEIIIVNDGSRDSTKEVIEDYINNHCDIPIKLINQKNSGVSASRNRGIRESNSEWIALLDSDDVWLENKLERQKEVIDKNKHILFLGSSYPLKIYLRTYKTGLHKLTAKQLCFRYTPSTPSVVFKRDVGIKLGLFDEKMHYCEDINFFQRFLKLDSYYVLAEDLVHISIGKRYHGEKGLSANLKKMHIGRKKNTIQLYRDGIITKPFLFTVVVLNELKFFRRKIITIVEKHIRIIME